MQIRIDEKIFEAFPETAIGYLVAKVSIKKTDPYVEGIKPGLNEYLRGIGINSTNFAAHPSIAIWRKIYEEQFQVKAKTYRSSIESLLRRVVTGKEIWNICNVVDVYNCCSVMTLLPMGGYDLAKIAGDINIRFGIQSETFVGLGERSRIDVHSNHVVYADASRVICWLWNHKDSAETCIDDNSKEVIFFIDSFDLERVRSALEQLAMHLQNIQCVPFESGILTKTVSQANIRGCLC